MPVSYLFIYSVEVWNSGDLPLQSLPIRYLFYPKTGDFIIFSVKHTTRPEIDFGKIEEAGSDRRSKRFIYELLNPGDYLSINFLTNESPNLSLHPRLPGMKIKQTLPKKDRIEIYNLLVAFAALFSIWLVFFILKIWQ